MCNRWRPEVKRQGQPGPLTGASALAEPLVSQRSWILSKSDLLEFKAVRKRAPETSLLSYSRGITGGKGREFDSQTRVPLWEQPGHVSERNRRGVVTGGSGDCRKLGTTGLVSKGQLALSSGHPCSGRTGPISSKEGRNRILRCDSQFSNLDNSFLFSKQ